MIHKITFKDGTVQAIQIIATTFKKLKVWLVQFKDGKQAMLYKCGSEWLQRTDDFLDASLIKILGKYIDGINGKDQPRL
jgi:hypothetical protein